MSTIYAIKRKLEAIKIHNAELNRPKMILRMWCPNGKTTHQNTGNIQIIPSNPEDAET